MAWNPQPGPQTSALLADWVTELFYGGERGGGKSDFQLGYQEDGALRYRAAHRGIMFRKTYAELEELQSRARDIFSGSGAVYKSQPSADYPFSNCWYWSNGASVKMRYIENEMDYGRYHGHQYSAISFDEVTEYATPFGLLKMISTLRSAHNVPCTIRLTGNPGGVGHEWVKKRYVDTGKPMRPYRDPESGMLRMFIPSKLSDNLILIESDPDYRSRLLAATSGNTALRKAWLEGSWEVGRGTFFTEEMFRRYTEKPKNCHVYGMSDYAVTDEGGDFTEHGVWGIDPQSNLWALDWWSGQTAPDVWVDTQLDLANKHKPLAWCGESGVIRRAIEPFLKKRMQERNIYVSMHWLPSIADKPTRARAFQARASAGKVYIPVGAWGDELIAQLLRFPNGVYDDKVDVCSLMGRFVDHAIAGANPAAPRPPVDRWARAFGDDNDVETWKTA